MVLSEMKIYQEIANIIAQGETAALCVIVKATGSTPRREGSKMLVYGDGRTQGTIGGGEMESRVVKEALEAIKEGKSRLVKYAMTDPAKGDPGVCGGQLEVYVEPILSQATVVVVGCGHIGKAAAQLAKWLGFWVVVSDDREGFATPEQIPDADIHHTGLFSELPEEVKIHENTYIVAATRNVKLDVEGLPNILETPAAYIGVIGSRRRWETTRKKLIKNGVSKKNVDRVVSPMGLELNADTPEEIALSIMAEIIMLRQGGEGGRMGA